MKLQVLGWSFRKTRLELRERLAFDEPARLHALAEIGARFDCEAAMLSTCNRVEVYVGRSADEPLPDGDVMTEFVAQRKGILVSDLAPGRYEHQQTDAMRHLFRVAAGLDSLVLGETQVTGQVRLAYELGQRAGSIGPLLHALFQHASVGAGRVRTETGIARGRVSIASVAIEYVRQVFAHFSDKTVLVIGAGKMGGLTLRHLGRLGLGRILVTNRSSEKARTVALSCGGESVPWDQLNDALSAADIVLSTTGASEPVVTEARYRAVRARRGSRTAVILDLAVPRDFDPAVHDGESTWLFNVDDLARVRERTLRDRQRHLGHAEAIIAEEQQRFLSDWLRRRNGPLIARLTEDFEAKRRAVLHQLLGRLNGRLTAADQATIEGAFRLLQNQFLHGPISALAEEMPEGGRHTLREALRRLFRLAE